MGGTQVATAIGQRRQFNDGRKRLFGTPGRVIAFVCECADSNCRNTVLLTAVEYDARRPGLIIDPRHGD
jgi:hypothetical protein